MKKLVMTLAMVMMLAACSVCGATAGKVLDTEMGMVDKFINANDYKVISAMTTAEFQKDFTAESLANFHKSFGKLTKEKFIVLNKYDEGDSLEYIMAFEKIPMVIFQFNFNVKNEKPVLDGYLFKMPPKGEQAPAAPAPANE